jgi:hypothetical protein
MSVLLFLLRFQVHSHAVVYFNSLLSTLNSRETLLEKFDDITLSNLAARPNSELTFEVHIIHELLQRKIHFFFYFGSRSL